LSPTSQMNLTPLQVDMVMSKFREIGIVRDEVRESEGRTLRFLYFMRDHPLVRQILGT